LAKWQESRFLLFVQGMRLNRQICDDDWHWQIKKPAVLDFSAVQRV